MIRDAMIERTEEEWDAIEDAVMTVLSFKEGQTLAASDIEALHLVDRYRREDEEAATDAYNRGFEEGLRRVGGEDLVAAHKRADEAYIEKSTERTMRKLAERRAEAAESRIEALEKGLESLTIAENHRITSGSPGPLYTAGWNEAFAAVATFAGALLSTHQGKDEWR